VATLSACALSPGMYMGGPQSAEQAVEDAAPPGALTTITPDLIAQQKQELATDVRQEVKNLFGKAQPYTIGPGDFLNVVVWNHPELALTGASSSRSMGSASQADIGNGYNVNADGTIQFPFVGSVKVAGMTEAQVRDMLKRRLATYINEPQITVRIQSYRHRRVYIDGEVRNPGLQVMDDLPMTLPEVLNRAGGFTPEADRSSVVLTRDGKKTDVNLTELARLGVNPNRIVLKNGDMIRVMGREESEVYVLGEVLDPNAQPMRDGKLSLGEALAKSGGPSPITSNPSQIYVIREADDGRADIYHLNAGTPVAYVLANQFQLEPRDIVYVDPAAVVRWNRVISMLLPSYGAIVTGTRLTR